MACRYGRGALCRILIFYICYISLKGSTFVEMLDGVRSISSSLYVGKILTTIEITTASDVNKNKYKSTNMAMSTKLIKACKLIQCSILAALIIAAGDVSPNPGWTCSALNQKGLKIAHLTFAASLGTSTNSKY